MNKKNIFVAHLARGAAAATALAFTSTTQGTSAAPKIHAATELASEVPSAFGTDTANQAGTTSLVLSQAPTEWDDQLEKEFRALALKEVAGTLAAGDEADRLERLNALRNRLRNPLSSEDMLNQIRHDRLMDKMEQVLREYVEFQQSQSKTR